MDSTDDDMEQFFADLNVFMRRHVNSHSRRVGRAMTYLAPLHQVLRQEVQPPLQVVPSLPGEYGALSDDR